MFGFTVGLFLIFLLPVAISVLAIRKLPLAYQKPTFIGVCMLLLTPSWGPATIVGVLVPFGLLFSVSLFGGFIHELPSLVISLWWWHIIVFPLVGLVAYVIGGRLFTNKRL